MNAAHKEPKTFADCASPAKVAKEDRWWEGCSQEAVAWIGSQPLPTPDHHTLIVSSALMIEYGYCVRQRKVCRSHHYWVSHQVSSLHFAVDGPRLLSEHFEPDFIPHVTECLGNFIYPFCPPRIILADMKKASQQPGVKRSAKPKAQANGTGADESAPDQAKPGPKANPKRVPKAKAKWWNPYLKSMALCGQSFQFQNSPFTFGVSKVWVESDLVRPEQLMGGNTPATVFEQMSQLFLMAPDLPQKIDMVLIKVAGSDFHVKRVQKYWASGHQHTCPAWKGDSMSMTWHAVWSC